MTNQTLAYAVLIVLMVVAANIPFVSERVLGIIGWKKNGQPTTKSFWLRLLEVLVLYVIVVLVGFAFEAQLGNRFAQGWEFYAITLAIFVVCAYPGFVWRYLRRRRKTPPRS